MTRAVVFVVDLVQDVNILRPLLGLARRVCNGDIWILASTGFYKRDPAGLWLRELREACGRAGIAVLSFAGEFEALRLLQGNRGLLIAAAESSVSGHAPVHNLFGAAPSTFIRVTLQHGFECVGFLHNAAHDRVYGQHARFNADLVCGWFGGDLLRSVAPSERSKLAITGPTLLIADDGTAWEGEAPADGDPPAAAGPACLICENLHSVRLGTSVLKSDFIAQFTDFCGQAAAAGLEVWLRPHPHGRYTDVKAVALPDGVRKSSLPIYRERLARFDFAVSAPSSVLFDLLVAGVPVAVWQDGDGEIDCRNYRGLPVISAAEDWWDFAERAVRDRERLLADQRDFMARLMIPADVEARYSEVLRSFG